jgi:hypothetical protein
MIMLQLPAHPVLSKQSVICVGNFSEWLGHNSEPLFEIVPLLFAPMVQLDTMGVASEALFKLCDIGGSALVPALNDLLTAVEPLLADSSYPVAVRQRCHEALACVLKHAPKAELAQQSRRLFDPLQAKLAQASSTPMTPEVLALLQPELQMLQSIPLRLTPEYDYHDELHPLARLVMECQPYVTHFMLECSHFPEIVKDVCCLRSLIRSHDEHMQACLVNIVFPLLQSLPDPLLIVLYLSLLFAQARS